MSDLINRKQALDDARSWVGMNWYEQHLMRNVIEWLEEFPSPWIPVEQALPEEPFGCLVTVWDEEPMTGEMFENLLPYFVGWDGEQWNDGDGQQCPFEVIAWMPLPEPMRLENK